MMIRRLQTFAFVLSLVAVQTGCGASALPAAPSVMAKTPSAGPVAEAAPAAPPPAAPGAPSPGPAPAPADAPVAQGAPAKTTAAKPTDTRSAKNAGPTTRAAVIIYQGDLKMMADEDSIPKTIDKIIDIAESLGGNVAGRKDQS